MTTEPIVSVVIPVYNGSNFLKYAIESALSQTYRKCEIIVINDGSDDQGITKQIAKSYGVKIKYAEQENRGTAAALNHGLRLMNGEYFVWLSHDDTLMPYKVEAQLEAIRKSGNEDIIAQGNYSFINEATGGFVSTRFHEHYPIETINNGCFLFLWGETHFSNLLFSSKHFERIGTFNENAKTTQDQDMQFRLLRGRETVFIKEPVSMFRIHDESGSIKQKSFMFKENRALYLNMLNSLGKEEIESSGTKAGVLYARIASVVYSMGIGSELVEIEKLLQNELDTIFDIKSVGLFAEILNRGIVIFGAGAYGRRVKYELECRGISPTAFIDNDSSKCGTFIDGILCCGLDSLQKMEYPYVVIGQKAYADAYYQLRSKGYKYIILKDELDSALWSAPPSRIPKWEE